METVNIYFISLPRNLSELRALPESNLLSHQTPR